MTPRRSDVALAVMALGLAALAVLAIHARWSAPRHEAALRQAADLVATLGLTDPALFTEARYTRHPSQADLFTPFQDAPGAPEHFPTGSLLSPAGDFGPATGRILKAGEGGGS